MHNNRKYCTHSHLFSKKTISHSKTIETNLSLSLRNEPLIPINSNTLLRTYRSRYLSLPLTHTRLYPPTHALVPSLLPTNMPTAAHIHTHSSLHFPLFHRSRSGFSTLAPSVLHTCAPTAVHLRLPTHASTAPHLCTFALFFMEEAKRLYDGSGVVLPYKPIFAPKLFVLLYDGSGGMFPYKQIVAPMLSEGMYGGIGEKSIEYPRKVYRVLPESL